LFVLAYSLIPSKIKFLRNSARKFGFKLVIFEIRTFAFSRRVVYLAYCRNIRDVGSGVSDFYRFPNIELAALMTSFYVP